ncbi:hypothetical protein Tco_0984973 [Tanacetum coccineum]
MKRVNSFVPMDSEVVEGSKSQVEGSKKRTRTELDKESVKRQKLEDDAEKAELKACLEIVPRDDEVVNVESLATKYPIVDWKTYILAEHKMYYEIIRAYGSTKFYKIFTAMLDDFDRQDVLDLYRKYTKSLLLLAVKLMLLVLVTTVRRVSAARDEHYEPIEEMTRRLDMCEDVQVLTTRDGIRRLLDSFYVVDYLLIYNTYVRWKPSRDFTRPLGPPSGLKGLLHTLNATVIPMKLYRILMVLAMVEFARRSRLGAWLRACCLFIMLSKSKGVIRSISNPSYFNFIYLSLTQVGGRDLK